MERDNSSAPAVNGRHDHERLPPPPATDETGEGAVTSTAADDPAMELLRDLIFGEYRQQIARMRAEVQELQGVLDALEAQINDKEALVNTITPVIADAIRTNIRESQSEMVDALYPILGKLVQRSVTEAMRELAQRIDRQMRRTFNFKDLVQRVKARVQGISDAEIALRNALPFQVRELFLIHRESGLPLLHTSNQLEEGSDSDIIGSMLTAIRDFAEDAFGRGEKVELNQIQYGDQSILIEVAHLVYIAGVVQGIEPPYFREQMRETMIAIEHHHAEILREYNGDAEPFMASAGAFAALLAYDTERVSVV
jgi:BMFP domain-containing protein YqiC